MRGTARVPPLTDHDISPPDSSDSTAGERPHRQGGEDVGPQSTIRRSGRAKRLMPLAAALLLATLVAIPSSGIA